MKNADTDQQISLIQFKGVSNYGRPFSLSIPGTYFKILVKKVEYVHGLMRILLKFNAVTIKQSIK